MDNVERIHVGGLLPERLSAFTGSRVDLGCKATGSPVHKEIRKCYPISAKKPHFYSNMVEVSNLVKKYGSLKVVNNVSLQIGRGELVSITGTSGAGKSTLLHLMGALDIPDAGRVTIDGVDLFALPARKQAKFRNEKIGFVFQFHHLLPEFTALENIAMPLWIAGRKKSEGLQEAKKLLGIVGLSERADHKPAALSGGEQQRVAIARALVNKPAIVMADEPTGNLDSVNADAIHRLFVQLRRELSQTFVLVTHNKELAALTDRNLEMLDGSIVSASGSKNEVWE